MAYNLEKMSSLSALKKILLVMDHILTRAELRGLPKSIVLVEKGSLGDVPEQEYEDIVSSLFKENILKNKKRILYELAYRGDDEYPKETDGTSYHVTINYEGFDNFRKKVAERIKELKGEKRNASRLEFDPAKVILYIDDHEIKVQKFSDQYHLLKIIFEDKKESLREWFFDEIIEKYDPVDTSLKPKKFYNAIYQLNKKIAVETGIKDFFTITIQTFQINKAYTKNS